MKSVHVDDVKPIEPADGVTISPLIIGEEMSVIGYKIEPDAVIPEHSHHFEQAGYVNTGTGEFSSPDSSQLLAAGDSYLIPGDEPHKVENVGDTPLKGVETFSPPRENFE